LQTFRHFIRTTFMLVLLCYSSIYSQDLPTKNETIIPLKKVDTIATRDVLVKPELNQIELDTVKIDSVKSKDEFLTGIIDYYGDDYVYLDKKENKVYMYNNAYITYEDMRIESGYITLDYNKNEIYAKGIDSAGIYSQTPIFTQTNTKVIPDSIRFNMDTKKALIYNSMSSENNKIGIGTKYPVFDKLTYLYLIIYQCI